MATSRLLASGNEENKGWCDESGGRGGAGGGYMEILHGDLHVTLHSVLAGRRQESDKSAQCA